ncbi:class I SAM-dependent methyltransferase [Brachyspira murdochii]|uniref:Methyltransferase type 12 n=1 Tax=Brachyspira murdochii (strain ATCC 51284 / DSM 12563 / 56-150) TaxID=526224 RepID=D5U4I8_BRAM5|nr:class I SAM-dependent methyltransferase [Brachyspira murdochii]ADG70233.1 Methyltransferase type 12 [Brachyspira murdochii DSM 12563]
MVLQRICPICDCEEGENLYEINFAKAKEEFIPEHYDIVACNNCGFIFNNTVWTQKDYDKYYSNTTKYSSSFTSGAGGLSNLDKIRYNGVIDRIEKFINKDSSIIDIGCAKGGLLRAFQDRGYTNLYGIESSKEAIENLKQYNIGGEASSIFDLKNIDKKFDVVILSQVLEHIYDLKNVKYILENILNDNGILYIDIPDATSYIKNKLAAYYYFDLEHINHFSLITLEYLFDNFKLVEKDSFYFDNVSNIKSYIIYGVFQKGIKLFINKLKDFEAIKKMKEYINYSCEIDKYTINNIDNTKSTYCWGFGAFLRRILLDKKYFSNCNIDGIIDKNESFSGKKIIDYKGNKIEVFTPNILQNTDNVIITSILYSEIIKQDLLNDVKFNGRIHELRAEQSRAEQSRAELIFSYYCEEAA